jgi:negative regulator of replication initiation
MASRLKLIEVEDQTWQDIASHGKSIEVDRGRGPDMASRMKLIEVEDQSWQVIEVEDQTWQVE